MKKVYKKLLLIATFALSVVGAEAKIIDLGVAGGVNMSNVTIPGLDDYINNKSGFQVGAQASLSLPIISVTPEVWYMQNGFSFNNPLDTSSEIADVKVQSFDLPVVVGLSLFKIITLEAGPRFSLWSKATVSVPGFEDTKVDDFRSEMGYVAGARVTILNKIFAGVRYNGEFKTTNLDIPELNLGLNAIGIKNDSYSIFVGYKF